MMYFIRLLPGCILAIAIGLLFKREHVWLVSLLMTMAVASIFVKPRPPVVLRRNSYRRTPKPRNTRHNLAFGIWTGTACTVAWLAAAALEGLTPTLRNWWNGYDPELVAAASAHVDSLVAATGPVWRDPDAAVQLLDKASELDVRHKLNHQILRERKAQWTPAQSLKADIAARLVGQQQQGLVWSCDLAIAESNGRHITGLQVRDFRVQGQGQRFTRFAVEETTTPATRLHVAVALDCSNSTTGVPHTGAIDGACRLAESLTDRAQLRLWSFSNAARAESPWTPTVSDFTTKAKALLPGGHTALLQALDAAVSDLATRNGRRVLVVFSDGRDTVGGSDVNNILRLCSEHQVSIYGVVLQTQDIDVPLLTQFTSESRGQLLLVNDPTKLISSFESIVKDLMKPIYRVTLLLDESVQRPDQFIIGRDPGITCSIPEQPRVSAQR